MPQRTVSAAGGNFSATATWVEAAVPGTGDFIVGDASSGQLTVNGNYSVQLANFSAYTNTITFNAGNTLTITSANTTTIFSSGTTFAGDGTLSFANAAQTLNFQTTSRVPNLVFVGGNKTLSANTYCTNFTNTPSNTAILGSSKLFVDGNCRSVSGSFAVGAGSELVVDGTGFFDIASYNGNGRLVFDTTGTTTFTGSCLSVLDNGTIVYSGGTMVTPRLGWTTQSSVSLGLYTSGMTWDMFSMGIATSINATYTFNLFQDFNVSLMNLPLERPGGNEILSFGQTGRLNVTDRMILQTNSGNFTEQANNELRLNTTGAHYVDKLFALSQPNNKFLIRSTTGGVKATLNVGDDLNSPIFYIDFQDINASGGDQINTYQGTVTNCDNVSSYSGDIFSSGGGGGSFTFVN